MRNSFLFDAFFRKYPGTEIQTLTAIFKYSAATKRDPWLMRTLKRPSFRASHLSFKEKLRERMDASATHGTPVSFNLTSKYGICVAIFRVLDFSDRKFMKLIRHDVTRTLLALFYSCIKKSYGALRVVKPQLPLLYGTQLHPFMQVISSYLLFKWKLRKRMDASALRKHISQSETDKLKYNLYRSKFARFRTTDFQGPEVHEVNMAWRHKYPNQSNCDSSA